MKHKYIPYVIPYEIAKNLKEKGFNEPVSRYYMSNGLLAVNSEDSGGNEREYHFTADDFNENWNIEGWVISKDGGMCFGCKLDNVKYFIPYSAPQQYQVVDWLREKHKLLINILPTTFGKYCIVIYRYPNNEVYQSIEVFETYYEALNNAIKQALDLI
jgi:hypothetical protein